MGRTVQKGVRIPEEWVPRIATVGKRLSPHVELSEASVLRAVVGAGLDALEAKLGIAPPDDAPSPEPSEPKGGRPARKPK